MENVTKLKAFKLPSTYVEVADNEMEYLDGGVSFWEGVLIAGCLVCALALIATLVVVTGGAFGLISAALAAKLYAICGIAFSAGAIAIMLGAAVSRGIIVRLE